jgi:2-keto-4-pentenoate hydratase/2-oxohepta-3-ene-1,7-dioic acid hydratase in catechol pathway
MNLQTLHFNHIKVEKYAQVPSKIVCIGRNYLAHIQELGNELPEDMVIFNKSNAAISTVLHSQHMEHALHYEAEICFAIKNQQLSAVGVGLDLTKRDLQNQLKAKGLPWEKCKTFDGSALFSDFISLQHPAISLSSLLMTLHINDRLAQQADIAHMIYKPDVILAEIKRHMTLVDHDVIMTGTPAGVGPVMKGDVFIARLHAQKTVLIEQHWTAI